MAGQEHRLSNTRPRDRLGRPLPWGATSELVLEPFETLTLAENDSLARAHLRDGEFFPAHEAWEAAWRQSKGTPDEECYKGLSQLGAGYVHLLRGNAHGAVTLLRRAAGRLVDYPDRHLGLPVAALVSRAQRDAAAVTSGQLAAGAGATLPPFDV